MRTSILGRISMTTKQGLSGAVKLTKALFTPESAMSQKRLALCLSCTDHLDPQTERCKLCKCFVHSKVKLVNEACPAGKW